MLYQNSEGQISHSLGDIFLFTQTLLGHDAPSRKLPPNQEEGGCLSAGGETESPRRK